MVVIGTSYLSLFSKGQVAEDPRVFSLVTVLLMSILVLHRVPEAVFGYRFFPHALVVVNTVLVTVGIGLNRATPWDLFLLFFFGLFIAGIGESLIQIVMGCLIISIIFVVLTLLQGMSSSLLDSDLLLRIPFVFGVSILYGYLAEQVKREKRRAEKSEETDRLKRQLVSALAHDIKNPLGVIMGYAENVASRLEGLPEGKEILEPLQRIQDNTQRIVKLVTGFLDASKAEAGKLEVVQLPVQLNLLIREVGQQQMGDLRKKNLSLSVDLDDHLPEIMGDEAQLDRVLWNLIGNAIKFTPMGGKITVTSRLENGHVCVSVKDTGMGIPKDELPLLFSEFRRLKGTAKIEGTGLGLFIVKTVVEAHGGTVAVESKEGQGTTFSIRFPIRP
ncbi:MAG: sensor histidine kinase [Candidatus Binatia bacterium]